MRFRASDRPPHGLPFVAPEIVHHHHIARAQGWDENVLDIGPEGFAVDRAVQNKWRVNPVVAQGCDECHGAPVSVWCAADQALTLGRPSPEWRHVGLGPGLINEDKATRVDPPLMALPAGAAAAYIGAVLFLGELGLFLNEYPVRCTKAQTVR